MEHLELKVRMLELKVRMLGDEQHARLSPRQFGIEEGK